MMHREFWEAGYRVFGLYGATPDGKCGCGNPDCKAVLKHPVSAGWQHTPLWDEEQLASKELSGQFDTGFGVLVRGLLVIDVDARNGGVQSYERLRADRIRAESDVERLTAELAAARAQAREELGTDDEAEIRRLETEYNMYFSGRLRTPPWDTRRRVDEMIKQFDRAYIPNYGERFRFTTLQSRAAKLAELWDRGLRAREEGRGGSALHFAVRKRYKDIIRQLASFGIDMNLKDQDGLTALDYTQSRGFMPFMANQTPLFREEAALLRELGEIGRAHV